MWSLIIGFLGSLAPEVFKLLNKSKDNAHELSLLAAQLEIQKAVEAERTNQHRIDADATMYKAETDLMGLALQSQDKAVEVEGVYNWVKSANALVRPALGLAVVFILYMGLVSVFFPAAFEAYEVLLQVPLVVDSFGTILAYWLCRRALDKAK